MNEINDEYNDTAPSKTQDKEAASSVQELGEALVALKPADRNRLPLTQELIAALDEAKRISSPEASRRHAQYIGKLMRRAEHSLIEKAFTELRNPMRKLRLQNWLTQVEQADNKSLQPLLQQLFDWFPHADRQHLRNLLRNLQKKHCDDEANAQQKQLFLQERRKLSHYLNELEQAAPLLPDDYSEI